MIPNPGSDEAIKKGCTCPVLDNGYGSGCGWKGEDGEALFWITQGCPLHAKKMGAPEDAHDTTRL
jgi:hypothetical protein